MASSSPSLRNLYKNQPDIWTFPQANQTASSASSGSVLGSSKWDGQIKSQSTSSLAVLRDEEDTVVSANVVLNGLLASALLQYATTAIAMPLEVGKLLLQIQYVPQEMDHWEAEPTMAEEIEQEISEDSEDSYFQDPDGKELVPGSAPQPQRQTRKDAELQGPSLTYVIPIGSQVGVWGMMKRIGRWRTEGWSSLFKGLLTASVTDAMSSAIQPIMHNMLVSVFPYSPYSSSLLVPVLSHLCTGVLLSPLDLVRTRLIAQSASSPFRTYKGPIDALSHILREEGGLRGVYLHPHLLFPAVLENTLRPLLALSLPFVLGSVVGMNEDRPIGWTVVEFVAGCAGLLVTLPIETIRRRLQIQPRGKGKPMATCVHTRRQSYYGVVDAFWRILSEECSDGCPLTLEERDPVRREKRVRSPSWYSRHGLGQLYRGLGMGVGAGITVLVLTFVTGAGASNSGWTEL